MPAPDDTAAPRWTPGPWLYELRLLWRGNRKLMPEELVKLPDISGWIDGALNEDEEALANATLIASAPTMALYVKKRADAGDAEAAELWEAINANP